MPLILLGRDALPLPAGRVFQILKNWPERRVKAICLTDGERVGALGDLGVQVSGLEMVHMHHFAVSGAPHFCLHPCSVPRPHRGHSTRGFSSKSSP